MERAEREAVTREIAALEATLVNDGRLGKEVSDILVVAVKDDALKIVQGSITSPRSLPLSLSLSPSLLLPLLKPDTK